MTKTPEELTEEWKAGKLAAGYYYIKFKNGEIETRDNLIGGFLMNMKNPIIQVIAPVPTYDEYKAMQKELAELKEKIKKREELIQCLGSNIDELDVKKSVLIIENNKLRGLLKECKEELEYHSELIFCELESDNSKIEFKHLLTRINAALGESEEK